MNEFLHVTGRMVSGNAFEQQPDRTDPKTGNVETGKYFVGVAVPKTDPQGAAAKAAVEAIAQQAWPNGEWQYPNFSMKIKDGDGLPQNKKEGYPGCWIFGFSQSWPFRVYNQGATQQLVDPKAVKRGDYIRVPFKSQGNNANVAQNQTPGVYLNAELIEFVGYGEAIQAGIDPALVMSQIGAAQTPAGASATPVATGPIPTTGGAQTPAAGGMVRPHEGFLNPGQGGAPELPTVPVAPVMTAKAEGMTYESFIAKSWTDELLRQHGYIV